MKLYKYIANENALKNIVAGKIKFATLATLNDPTELFPFFYDEELKKSLQEKRKKGYSEDDLMDLKKQGLLFEKLAPGELILPTPKTIEDANSYINNNAFDNIEGLRMVFKKIVKIMSENCGIFCLSTRFNSLPMWAHYANNANGFVIEFENLKEIYNGDGTGILNEIKKVTYTKKRSGINFSNGSYNNIFIEKDEDWGYEKENRIITELKKCENLKIDKNNSIKVQQIDKKYISKVIFGWKVKQSEIDKLVIELKNINPNVKFSTAKIVEGMINVD